MADLLRVAQVCYGAGVAGSWSLQVADACDVTREEKAPFDSLGMGRRSSFCPSRGPLYHVLRLVFRVIDVLEGCPRSVPGRGREGVKRDEYHTSRFPVLYLGACTRASHSRLA